MRTYISALLIFILTGCVGSLDQTPPNPDEPSAFTGTISFIDPTCPNADPLRFCRLKSTHSFSSAKTNKSWQTDPWGGKTHDAGNNQIQTGTTNGADIPKLVQRLVGRPFDAKILPAAIIHDHYTFKENRVINWFDTHLMYLQILLDQNLDPIKAYTQYFAIYTFGAHWTDVVKGEECTNVPFPCIKVAGKVKGRYHQESRLHTQQAAKAIEAVYHHLSSPAFAANKSNRLNPAYIQELALLYDPANLFLQNKQWHVFPRPKNQTWLSQNTTFVPSK
jgi:hypothetical protein